MTDHIIHSGLHSMIPEPGSDSPYIFCDLPQTTLWHTISYSYSKRYNFTGIQLL